MRFLPATISATPIGRWAVKLGSVILISLGVRQLVGPKAARQVAIGGAVYLAATAVAEFLPGMIEGGTAKTAYYGPGQLGSQPLVGAGAGEYSFGAGAYPGLIGAGAYSQDDVPERFRVGNRF